MSNEDRDSFETVRQQIAGLDGIAWNIVEREVL